MSFAKAVCRTRNNPKTDSKSINFFCINCSGFLSMTRHRNRKMQSHISYPLVKLFLFLLAEWAEWAEWQCGQCGFKKPSVKDRGGSSRQTCWQRRNTGTSAVPAKFTTTGRLKLV